jgi:hypothetical protein
MNIVPATTCVTDALPFGSQCVKACERRGLILDLRYFRTCRRGVREGRKEEEGASRPHTDACHASWEIRSETPRRSPGLAPGGIDVSPGRAPGGRPNRQAMPKATHPAPQLRWQGGPGAGKMCPQAILQPWPAGRQLTPTTRHEAGGGQCFNDAGGFARCSTFARNINLETCRVLGLFASRLQRILWACTRKPLCKAVVRGHHAHPFRVRTSLAQRSLGQ